MGGQLKRIEPTSCTGLQEDQDFWSILRDNGIAMFLERMSEYSALVSYSALATWSHGKVQIGNTCLKKINLAAFLFQSLEHSINLARE
ncbi:hypothetical protein KI387_008184, partial [Taxus chinensis]